MTIVRPAHCGPGPMRGTDPRETARVVLGECHDLPFLPELATRGLGADLLGRSLAMLTDLPFDISPRGWRLARSSGRAARRAVDLLERDCDALEEATEAARDPEAGISPAARRLQIRVTGPWSLAAAIELPGGLPVLTDRGARRDLAAALADGVAERAGRLARAVGARPRILLDEPLLWRVVAGTVAPPSRLDPIPAVPAEQLGLSLCRLGEELRRGGVAEVVIRVPSEGDPDAPPVWPVVAEPPRGEVPLDGVCLPAEPLYSARSHSALDAAGAHLGDGRILQLEGLPGPGGPPRNATEAERAAAQVVALLDRLGAPREDSLARLVLTPGVAQITNGRHSDAEVLAGVRRVADAAARVVQ